MLGVVVTVLRGRGDDRVVPATSTPSAVPSFIGPPPTGRIESIVPECAKMYGNGVPVAACSTCTGSRPPSYGGRVAANVAKMTLTVGDDTVDVHLQDHTFAVRYDYQGKRPDPVLKAFDANGNALPGPGYAGCLTLPSGERLSDAPPSGGTCPQAVAWP
ncbi:hypothetical protein [Cryptosporangium phraense]|uniref:Uncharacterized protein n=1 Tax=Cryptosporangium phraense TaxID=2593070 RepID=A0A545AWA5_9ACTN|nr:hypothetical protein [Cryptosporangium phraense]TQS45606.1 hypothetical protein FL583_07700 [Cryptosporangium phraense]